MNRFCQHHISILWGSMNLRGRKKTLCKTQQMQGLQSLILDFYSLNASCRDWLILVMALGLATGGWSILDHPAWWQGRAVSLDPSLQHTLGTQHSHKFYPLAAATLDIWGVKYNSKYVSFNVPEVNKLLCVPYLAITACGVYTWLH